MTIPPAQELKMPERYAKLGARTGFAPPPADRLRMILEAEAGHGKSTFLMSIPKLLVFDFDRACEAAIDSRATYAPIRTWAEYTAIKNQLLADAKTGDRPFTRVGFDTCDAWLRLLDRFLVDPINAARKDKGGNILQSIVEYGESGAGYTKLTGALLRELRDFDDAGYPFILTDHLRVRKTTVGDVVITDRRCSMPPSTMEAIIGLVDVKARISRSLDVVQDMATRTIQAGGKTITTKIADGKPHIDDKYWLGLMPVDSSDEQNDTKRRIPKLQGITELPLIGGWGAFVAMYDKSCEQALALANPK